MLQCSGLSSPIGGALEAGASVGWHILPALNLRAIPSGTAGDLVLETFWRKLFASISQMVETRLDGIFVLQGAIMCRSIHDVESGLLKRIRVLFTRYRATPSDRANSF